MRVSGRLTGRGGVVALRLIALVVALLLGSRVPGSGAGESAPVRRAVVVALEGPIGPAMAAYVVRSLEDAAREQAAAVVLRLDTPGGLDSAMRDIIRAMLASPVAVIGYVAPGGARAASAGTYILYASALAAMAPGTNLGAATLVPLFGAVPPADVSGLPGEAKLPADAEWAKVTNDAAAYMRSLATLHGRNSDWAERAVREAVSLSYEAALREHVIDLVAANLPELLAAADGREVVVAGRKQLLATADAAIREVVPDWRVRLLATLTNPGILYMLMLAGVAGIVFELTHPGVFAPGVLGTICLLLAGYGLNLLPIDYAGAALALFGLGLMIAEAWVSAFGAFVIGGGGAFLIGSLMMFENPAFRPSLALVLGATLACAALFGVVLVALLRARRRPVVAGDAALFGAAGRITRWQGSQGQVLVQGVFWNASATDVHGTDVHGTDVHRTGALAVGGTVRVTGREGLRLIVEAV
jgi:membrane-bound serine protease (ClpP class)